MKAPPDSSRTSSGRFEVLGAECGRPLTMAGASNDRSTRVPRARRVERGRPPAGAAACGRSTAQSLLHAQAATPPASTSTPCGFPDDLEQLPLTTKAELVADQDGASAVGHGAHRADRAATRATARRRRRPGRRCAGSTRTRAGSGCSTAGRRCIAARASAPGDRVFFPFSFGPFLGFWAGVRGRPPDRRRTACPAAACRVRCAWR